MEISDTEERMELVTKQLEQMKEKLKLSQKSQKLPFHLRIQAKGNKQQLLRVEATQKLTFTHIIKKYHPELKNDKDLFPTYWMAFLAGEVKSIRDFLYTDASKSQRKLKRVFLVD